MSSTVDAVRTHVLVRQAILDEIDGLVGKRKRSEFIREAVERRLRQERQLAALTALLDSEPAPAPGLETEEDIARWVHDLRREGSGRARRLEAMQRPPKE